jgi:hypothetical protein
MYIICCRIYGQSAIYILFAQLLLCIPLFFLHKFCILAILLVEQITIPSAGQPAVRESPSRGVEEDGEIVCARCPPPPPPHGSGRKKPQELLNLMLSRLIFFSFVTLTEKNKRSFEL